MRAAEDAGYLVARLELVPDGRVNVYTKRLPEQIQQTDADEIIAKLK